MMRKIRGIISLSALAIYLVLAVCEVFGQTVVTRGPVTTSMRFAWAAPLGISLTDLPTYEVRLRDSFTGTAVTALTNPQCSGTPISCTSQLTQSNVDALNMVGVHNISLAYFRQDTGEGSYSSPFVLTTPAPAPTNFRIIQ